MIKGITAGAFDLLHAGHVVMLEEARRQCDYLIVALHDNPRTERRNKNKPVQSIYERYLQLKACKFVDEIIPYDTEADLVSILKIVKPQVRFVGEEYRWKEFTGRTLCRVEYTSRKHDFSSSELRKRIKK